MPKIGIYLPVIRCDVAMETAIIQKLTPKNKPYYIGTSIGTLVSTGKILTEINKVFFFCMFSYINYMYIYCTENFTSIYSFPFLVLAFVCVM